MCDKRLWTIFILMVVVTGGLIWQLFQLQIVHSKIWRARAQGQHNFLNTTEGERGSVFLSSKNGNDKIPVAINTSVYYAFVEPRNIEEKRRGDLSLYLSKLLGIEEDLIKEKLQKDNTYEVLKRNLSKDEILSLRELEEVHIRRDFIRGYPEDSLAAHIIGFVGGQGVGQYGVEQYYNESLKGRQGTREGIKMMGSSFTTQDTTAPGEDLFLTIDYNIQHFVESELERAVERTKAESGSVVVGDPHTGAVIAIANYPSFDLNQYSSFSSSVMRNSAVQETFEPGSVFKPITMAIALEEGAINPNDIYNDTGVILVRGEPIYNYNRRSYGTVTMTKIMENSINTGMVYIKDQIGNKTFLKYLEKFRLFEPTDIDLHGEVFSENRSFRQGYDMNFATASYGQGIEVNMMHIFRSFSVIANGGRMITPFVLKKDEQVDLQGESVISPSTSLLVTDMLVSTVNQGFGKTAKVPGYYIAGKTGTAQVAWSKLGVNTRGYASGKTIQGFAGYAPAYNPEFVMFVKLNYPQTSSAEVSAAPVFREIAKYIFEYKKIPNDYDIEVAN